MNITIANKMRHHWRFQKEQSTITFDCNERSAVDFMVAVAYGRNLLTAQALSHARILDTPSDISYDEIWTLSYSEASNEWRFEDIKGVICFQNLTLKKVAFPVYGCAYALLNMYYERLGYIYEELYDMLPADALAACLTAMWNTHVYWGFYEDAFHVRVSPKMVDVYLNSLDAMGITTIEQRYDGEKCMLLWEAPDSLTL